MTTTHRIVWLFLLLVFLFCAWQFGKVAEAYSSVFVELEDDWTVDYGIYFRQNYPPTFLAIREVGRVWYMASSPNDVYR